MEPSGGTEHFSAIHSNKRQRTQVEIWEICIGGCGGLLALVAARCPPCCPLTPLLHQDGVRKQGEKACGLR